MAGITNRGKYLFLNHMFRDVTVPANFYIFLVSGTPDENTEDMAELTEVNVAGNETVLPKGTVSFDTIAEDQSGDKGTIKIKDCAFAGPVVAATFAVMADGNASPSSDNIWAYWSLGGAKSVSSGQTLTLQDLEIDLLES